MIVVSSAFGSFVFGTCVSIIRHPGTEEDDSHNGYFASASDLEYWGLAINVAAASHVVCEHVL